MNVYEQNVYRCKVLRVIDGDTVELEIDLGLKVKCVSPVRLFGIDSPEVVGEEKVLGIVSKEGLIKLIEEFSEDGTVFATFQKGKTFDRWIATLFVMKPLNGVLTSVILNDEMVVRGFAEKS